jgi:hypothetical protein
MSDVLPSQLANSIMGKLYDVLTNGDDSVPRSEDNFFSWCTPGMPVTKQDFEFLTQGFTGVVKTSAVKAYAGAGAGAAAGAAAGPVATELTPELVNQLLAQDVGRLYAQAESFSRLIDFVPDTSGIQDPFARLNVLNNEGSLSDRYEYILRFSQVAESKLPEETVKKIERFRGLLSVKTTKKNLIDDTETEVEEPSPLVQKYNEKLLAYENAALEYNARRIDALAASDPRAVHYFSMNAGTLRNRVTAAMSDWVAAGYKNDYEAIAAFIDQVMQRDMALLKAEYRDALEKARLTGLASGSDFYYSALAPANWVTASGWTRFSFASADHSRYQSAKSNKWGGRASYMGLFGASASGSRKESETRFDSKNFRLAFSIAQVPIVRPWFKPAFLLSKSWRFDQNTPEAKSQMVSDAGAPPKGLIPAFPTMLVVVKDLELSLSNASGMQRFVEQQVSGGGSAGFGPFRIGGSYSHGRSTGQQQFHADSQGIKVPGMQVIGFKCHVLPKSPDPLAGISNWV